MLKITKALLKIFEYYLWIHIVYFLIMIALIFAYSYEKFNLQCDNVLVWFLENIFFFIISCVYVVVRMFCNIEGNNTKIRTVITIIVFNTLSIVIFLIYFPIDFLSICG